MSKHAKSIGDPPSISSCSTPKTQKRSNRRFGQNTYTQIFLYEKTLKKRYIRFENNSEKTQKKRLGAIHKGPF